MEYPMVYANFDNLASYFQIFIVSRPRRCISDLDLDFIDVIIEATGKVVEKKISLAKL